MSAVYLKFERGDDASVTISVSNSDDFTNVEGVMLESDNPLWPMYSALYESVRTMLEEAHG